MSTLDKTTPTPPDTAPSRLLGESRHLALIERNDWSFVTRLGATGVVAVVAVTDDSELLLVVQYREPIGQRSIELPAGLVGDSSDEADETFLDGAKRELREETGYEASSWRRVIRGVTSAGLTDETVVIYLARGLQRVDEGGGDESESIEVHRAPLRTLDAWIASRVRSGVSVDLKVLAAPLIAATDESLGDASSESP